MSSFFNIVILLGALQGFINSALLFFSRRDSQHANRILSILILLISLACLNIYLLEGNYFLKASTFWTVMEVVVPLVIIMPAGPLIYFYVLASVQPGFSIRKEQRIHFYPVILDLVPSLIGAVYIIGVSVGWMSTVNQSSWGLFVDDYNMYVDIPRWISISTYTWIARKKLVEFQKNNHDSGSSAWPKQFVNIFILFQVIWLIHLIPYLIPALSQKLLSQVSWYPIYIPLAIMVYWLGIYGYFISRPQKLRTLLGPEIIQSTLRALDTAMAQDLLFLNPTLSVGNVAGHTGIQQKTISAVLNQHLGKSFNEYVNGFRVTEVKKRLLEPGYEHLTITGMALECGFNSQATFQRTFKQFTKQSPREFQLSNKQKTSI